MPISTHRPHRVVQSAMVAGLAVAVLAAGCSDGGGGGDDADPPEVDRSEIIAGLAEQVIVPGQERLATTTRQLARSTEELCAAPTADALDRARRAWDEARGGWASTAAYRLGPILSLRLSSVIAYPVDPEKVDELAADVPGAAPVTPESIGERGADVRGLDTVERLLFTPSDVSALTPRACAYAASAAQLVAEGAEELLAAWVEGADGAAPAVEQFTRPGGDSMWESSTEVLEDLLNSVLDALGGVAGDQLGPATGETTEEPEPQVVDAGPAHRALADIVDGLDGVVATYGDAGSDPPEGLSALVAGAATSTSDEAIRTDLASAIDAVQEVPPPLFDVDASDTGSPAMQALVRAYEHTMGARTALGTEVASLLGLTISFSDSDGDG